jgi:hypothetical protein
MLGIGSGSFDPETLVILETAFDEAWITLKTNGSGNIRSHITRGNTSAQTPSARGSRNESFLLALRRSQI